MRQTPPKSQNTAFTIPERSPAHHPNRRNAMAKTDIVHIRITPELKTQLQALAESEGRTVSNMIERLIKEALSRQETKEAE